ncbi:TraR/DksA C4-type zinc finger protein [Microbacterium sp. SORGH_AS_0888]|uniref:TraR/DksA family transcriptional regulator n=1 Tax=Microbacterium sp. SORGH_AS_0888 TaxID=3041791 RepID=UPI002783DFBD|nr:TraR/DksA C4-type zinc finger protein [Microbacterium sp. SORGH_AS_0888]MDQ1128843.1 DnaK suppressor protein [Microbacterium sp. SORGH_AS_0888]
MIDTTEFEAIVGERRRMAADRLAGIEADLAAVRAARSDAAGADDEHDPEGATTSGEWSRLAGLRRQTVAEIEELALAAERLAAGSYGVCAVCGAEIPEGRLRALPAATRCVACADRSR